jgi:PAS domain S-box-containing protein
MADSTIDDRPAEAIARLRDENEQLHTALETVLEENARLIDDRDRLLVRVSALSRDLQRSHAEYIEGRGQESALAAASALQSQTDEELRVAFEELQVLAEELEVANTGLHESNRLLDARVGERTRELNESNAALHATETSFRSLADLVPDLLWRTDATGAAVWFNQRWFDRTGQREGAPLGEGWLDVVHVLDRAEVRESWQGAVESGGAYQRELRIRDAAGSFRWFLVRATLVRDDQNRRGHWLVAGTDIHDIIQLQKRQGVLVAELQHRTRNLMAVVQAVTLRTLKASPSLAAFRDAIDDRLGALARVQSLLSRRASSGVTFDALLLAELSAHLDLDEPDTAARVTVSGPPDVRLPSTIVQTLALALHELATNAVKYGALSQPNARLEIRWAASSAAGAGQTLSIAWHEHDVVLPAASALADAGYGRELIERALPYQLDARTRYAFTADGVQCDIAVLVPDDEDPAEAIDG